MKMQREQVRERVWTAIAFITVTCALASLTDAAEFMGLSDFNGGSGASRAVGVSGDGSVVVGGRTSWPGTFSLNSSTAFRWTRDTGVETLGHLSGGSFSQASDASADGSVVVGQSSSGVTFGGDREAFRWTAETGMIGLGGLGGAVNTRGISVSADGAAVAGRARVSSGWRAYRWTEETGMVALLNHESHATSVSADGSVVAGYDNTGGAFRWTVEGGVEALGDLPGGLTDGRAFGVSADGSVVVGYGTVGFGPPGEGPKEAFRWTAESGMASLGGDNAWGLAASADGSTVVGRSGGEAFVWNEMNGLRNLQDVLTNDFNLGANLAGWTLTRANDVSDDGLTIVGDGISPDGNEEGWIATITPPVRIEIDFNRDGAVNVADADLLVAEIATGASGSLFDVTADGVVDIVDLDEWRSDAATHNGFTGAYLLGDSDLSSVVDSADLNNLALNWRRSTTKWSGGDFTVDGFVDAADLNALALNWRQSIPIASVVIAPVPEPSAWLLVIFGLPLIWRRSRRSGAM